MIANRELDLDDYLAMARRRLLVILILPLVGLAAGFLICFAFSPKYTSESLVGVERQTVNILPNAPYGQVRPSLTTTLRERMMALQQQVLSRNQLQTLVTKLGLARKGRSVDAVIAQIQSSVTISEVEPPGTPPPADGSSSKGADRTTDPLAFSVGVTADSARDAQQICSGVTSMLLTENLKTREQAAVSTTDFLSRQLVEARSNLDERARKFAAFKALHLGQLPSDVDNNLKILSELRSQLDADTQRLIRAQQDNSYGESLLQQQLAAWKSSQAFRTSETIEQRLVALQTQLMALQTQYTEDHPELIKVKRDIAALEAKQKEMGALSSQKANTAGTGIEAGIKEPPEIRALQERVHQNEGVIAQTTQEQRQLQEKINKYQGRLTLIPKVEEEYKQLVRDDETARQVYNSLLLSISQAQIQSDIERQQQGEQLRLVDEASLPGAPSFPDRRKFAVYGLGGGLALGLCIAMWLEFRDKAIRTEADVLAAVELPMLTSIPWVRGAATDDGWRGRFKTLWGYKGTA